MIKINIKWGQQQFKDIEVEQNTDILSFKSQVYSLTFVPIEKQKLIFKGIILKNDADLKKLTNGGTLMLIGQAEGKQMLIEPEVKTVFIEDLTPEEQAKILKQKGALVIPPGLVNLGNTCYLNSSLQCLKRINELNDWCVNTKQIIGGDQEKQLFTKYFQKLIIQMNNTTESFQPVDFVSVFMSIFPQFAERTKEGVFQQQDSDECFQSMLQILQECCMAQNLEEKQVSLIKELFEIQFEIKYKNVDLPDEPEKILYESQKKLMCNIDNMGKPINNLLEGIEFSQQEEITKNSEIDGKAHQYHKFTKIHKLPTYLCVQMVRFFWKQESQSAGSKATKAKILRQIAFPKVFDIYPYSSQELQKNLNFGRDREKLLDIQKQKDQDNKFEQYKKNLESKGKMIEEDTKKLYQQFKEDQQQEVIKQHDENLYAKRGLGLETGNYQLIAVLTHKGRSADSGHYVAWVHQTGEDWAKFDDDIVTFVKTEEVLNLKGGGDWHMGYYLIYRKLEVN